MRLARVEQAKLDKISAEKAALYAKYSGPYNAQQYLEWNAYRTKKAWENVVLSLANRSIPKIEIKSMHSKHRSRIEKKIWNHLKKSAHCYLLWRWKHYIQLMPR